MRHGRTAWNAAQRIQGHTDIPLDEIGLEQARSVGRAFAGEAIAAVYTSDLARARQTAEPIAAASGAPLVPLPALRERAFGAFEGVSFAELDTLHPEQAARWRAREPDFAPEGGESLRQFGQRIVEAASAVAARHAGEAIVLVAHGGVLDMLYRAATGLALDAPRSWTLANAAIQRVLHHGGRFTLLAWDDRAHLEGPAAA